MTLLECIEIAKAIQFVPPAGKTFDEYSYDEVQYFALSEMLKHHVLVYAVILICQKYTIAKTMFKSCLKDYIIKYGGPQLLPGRKAVK